MWKITDRDYWVPPPAKKGGVRWNVMREGRILTIMIRDWKPDKRRRVLENELLETEIMKNMIEIMKEGHYTDAEIKEYIDNHIVMPLNEVRPYQDRGLVSDAKIKALEESTPPKI